MGEVIHNRAMVTLAGCKPMSWDQRNLIDDQQQGVIFFMVWRLV